MSEKKKFGLVMPKKVDTLKNKISSIFNDESDDEEHIKKRPKIPQKKIVQKSYIKTETDLDPTIYEYDSIYDEMKTKQAESNKPKEVKQSRYIETLLKAADKRKKEYERRIDRKIQIERENEGDQFKDKEAFVTSSYKKKLQEKEEEEERERRENMLNDMMDVTKQKDLSGFYRHFLNQTIGEEKVPLFGEKEIKKEVESDQESTSNKVDENLNIPENLDQDSDGIEIDKDDDDSERDFSDNKKSDNKEKKKKTFRKKTTTHYRNKRNKTQSSDENVSEKSESPKPDKVYTRKSNINSNSDSSSSDDENNETSKAIVHSEKNKEKGKSVNKHNSRHDSSSSDDEHNDKSIDLETQAQEKKQKTEAKKEKQRNIYAKRTVGDVFAEAQARYFQRMATRNS